MRTRKNHSSSRSIDTLQTEINSIQQTMHKQEESFPKDVSSTINRLTSLLADLNRLLRQSSDTQSQTDIILWQAIEMLETSGIFLCERLSGEENLSDLLKKTTAALQTLLDILLFPCFMNDAAIFHDALASMINQFGLAYGMICMPQTCAFRLQGQMLGLTLCQYHFLLKNFAEADILVNQMMLLCCIIEENLTKRAFIAEILPLFDSIATTETLNKMCLQLQITVIGFLTKTLDTLHGNYPDYGWNQKKETLLNHHNQLQQEKVAAQALCEISQQRARKNIKGASGEDKPFQKVFHSLPLPPYH